MARSSRNRFLAPDQRAAALALSRGLRAGAAAGPFGAATVLAAAHAEIDGVPGLELDYLQLCSPDLQPAPNSGPARLLVAARTGQTRLIDNLPVELHDPSLDHPALTPREGTS
jgi:pantoate--beta-alanine ligase